MATSGCNCDDSVKYTVDIAFLTGDVFCSSENKRHWDGSFDGQLIYELGRDMEDVRWGVTGKPRYWALDPISGRIWAWFVVKHCEVLALLLACEWLFGRK